MIDLDETPTLSDLLSAAFDAGARDLRVSEPARVESYDPTTQKITAQPLIMQSRLDEVTGERLAARAPIVTDVPIAFPGGGGKRLTFPIAVGDVVLLVYSDRSLDRWLVRGGEVDPVDDRQHHSSDAVAIPVLYSFAAAPDAPDDRVRLGAPTGAAAVEITDDHVDVGGTSALALNSDLSRILDAIDAAVTAISGTNPTGAGALTALKTALTGLIPAWPAGTTVTRGG